MWSLSINCTITKYCFNARTAYHVVSLRKTVKAMFQSGPYRPGAKLAWLGGGRNKFWGAREVYFVWIREGRGGTRNLSHSGSNEQGKEQKFQGFFRPQSDFQAVFATENKKKGLHPKNVTKSGGSPQKTLIWASICAPEAPSLLISSGHSPRLGGTIFVWGGTSSQLGWHGPDMPPRGAGSGAVLSTRLDWQRL